MHKSDSKNTGTDPDLIIDAGASLSDVCGKFTFTRIQAEGFIHQGDNGKYSLSSRIGTEIFRAVISAFSRHYEFGINVRGQLYKGIGLGVLKPDIISWCVLLDKRILKR